MESHPHLDEHHKLDDTANFDTLRGATLLLLTIFAGCNWSYAMLRVMEVSHGTLLRLSSWLHPHMGSAP
jgi:hypothetical protein